MSGAREVRTSLEVGFPEGGLPERFAAYRGRERRAIPLLPEFPFEDAQFEVVLMAASAVSRASVREAHRVLRPEGRLYFSVPEKTRKQEGMTMPDIYAIVRDGFNIVDVERPAWWRFGFGASTITICACKKRWKDYKGFVRDGSLPFSPFRSRT